MLPVCDTNNKWPNLVYAGQRYVLTSQEKLNKFIIGMALLLLTFSYKPSKTNKIPKANILKIHAYLPLVVL